MRSSMRQDSSGSTSTPPDTAADAKALFGDNKSLDRIVQMADGKFMSAFVRARKP